MIILALAIGALCLWAGYQWGRGVGRTELERKIIQHVIDSPHYAEHVAKSIQLVLKRVR